MDEHLTPLVPVSQWKWYLWRVTYHTIEDAPAGLTKYCVSTETHIQGEVCEGDYWPGSHFAYARWEQVDEAAPPRNVGSYYGVPLSESGWEAGKREAARRAILG